MPRPASDTVQITIRVPRNWLTRAGELAKRIAPPGAMFGRTDGFRAAIAKGFEEFESELHDGKRPQRRGR